ncbi:MAG: hypothetical protein Q9221_004186 [Calogaya cf. arnoldii]
MSRDESYKGWQMHNSKLLEYAYLNWMLHLTESSSQTLMRQESILQHFLASRNSLYWLELCFSIDRDIYRTLSAYLQAVLDWCFQFESKDGSGSRTSRDLVSFSTTGSNHRALQKHTGVATENYGYFSIDEKRQVFFSLEEEVTTAPRIYCQEIISGKRLTPITDTEFEENNDRLKLEGATLSACGRYLGIVYSWNIDHNMTVYTAIWLLSEHFDFRGTIAGGPPQWARKIISLSTVAPAVAYGSRLLFSKDEKILLGAHESLSDGITRIIIWRQIDSSFLWAEKTIRGQLRGFCLDESRGLLYIVYPGRIWSRLDISNTGLIDLGSDSNEPRMNRIEYQVYRDGTQMVILRRHVKNFTRLDLQVVDLEELSELYRGPLKLPDGTEDTDEDPLLVKFSSDLEIVFVGNMLFRTKAPDTEPILLPIALLPKKGLESCIRWTCSFSACSTYVYDKRTIDFHPYLPELVLNTFASPIKYNEGVQNIILGRDPVYIMDDFKITTQLLNLEKETAITLESPTIYGWLKSGHISPSEYEEATIKYAACGTYVLFASQNRQHLSWRIPSRHPPPTPVLPRVLDCKMNTLLVDRISFVGLRRAIRPYNIDTLPDDFPRPRAIPPLTIVPEHLEKAHVTFLLSDNPDSVVRVLFATPDGHFEMKYLGFTTNQYLERLPAWGEESVRLKRDRHDADLAIAAEMDASSDDIPESPPTYGL